MADKKINVLIAEDAEQDADMLIHLLRKNGFELNYDLVTSREQMQILLEQKDYDLIISDFNMPGFTGMEALKLAKKHDSMLPFILLSGFIDQDQETEILKNGANEVIMKDNFNRLPFAVRRVLHEVEDKNKLKKLVKTKDTLFSVLAHDLRGTLEGIYVLAETLQQDVGKPSAAESLRSNLKMIAQTARSTNQLLGNVLNWALMQVGALKPSFTKVDLNECINKCININKSKATRKKIDIHVDSPPVKIVADENMLSIVFRNLISNAINFSNPGDNIEIEVIEEKDKIEVAVKDQGIGIPDDLKEKLFDPESRPTRPGTDKEESTGFGLLICKDVVKMHGGSISVDSESGNGSTFTVSLPREKVPRQTEMSSI